MNLEFPPAGHVEANAADDGASIVILAHDLGYGRQSVSMPGHAPVEHDLGLGRGTVWQCYCHGPRVQSADGDGFGARCDGHGVEAVIGSVREAIVEVAGRLHGGDGYTGRNGGGDG
jgi:hypothetical protein